MNGFCESPPQLQSRKFPRTEMALRVNFRVSGQETKREKTYTKIVGGGGLMMVTQSRLSPGTKVEMNLYHDSFVIPFEAEVVWVDQTIESHLPQFKCGLEYITDSNNGLMHIQYLLQAKLQNKKSVSL